MPTAARSNPYDFINDVANLSLFAGRRGEIEAVKEELIRLTAPAPVAPVVALVGRAASARQAYSIGFPKPPAI